MPDRVADAPDHQPVGTDRYCSSRERRNFVAFSCAVARVDENREMAETLDRRHDAQIKSIPGVVGECTYTALTEGDVVVALAEDVLGGHEEFFESGGHAALKQDRFAGASGTLEQRKFCMFRAPIWITSA